MPSTIDATFVYISQPITWLLGGQPSFVFVFNKCRITIICAHHIDTFGNALCLWKNNHEHFVATVIILLHEIFLPCP